MWTRICRYGEGENANLDLATLTRPRYFLVKMPRSLSYVLKTLGIFKR
jgi:hypothetical protein